jgi:hypothetical protein
MNKQRKKSFLIGVYVSRISRAKNKFKTTLKNIVLKVFVSIILKIKRIFSSTQLSIINSEQEINALKLELKTLENQLYSLDNEKIELEKLLSDFQNRYTNELGDLLLEILRIRKLLYQSDKSKLEEAEEDEKQYREQVNSERKQKKYQLTDDEKKELKKKFRLATFLCHPDKVNEQLKDTAGEIFIQLKEAYNANDLKKVTKILSNLEKGNYFKSKSETISEKELLKVEITKLHKRITILENEILLIKKSDTYKTVIGIDDWEAYIRHMKIILETELAVMKMQMDA